MTFFFVCNRNFKVRQVGKELSATYIFFVWCRNKEVRL